MRRAKSKERPAHQRLTIVRRYLSGCSQHQRDSTQRHSQRPRTEIPGLELLLKRHFGGLWVKLSGSYPEHCITRRRMRAAALQIDKSIERDGKSNVKIARYAA